MEFLYMALLNHRQSLQHHFRINIHVKTASQHYPQTCNYLDVGGGRTRVLSLGSFISRELLEMDWQRACLLEKELPSPYIHIDLITGKKPNMMTKTPTSKHQDDVGPLYLFSWCWCGDQSWSLIIPNYPQFGFMKTAITWNLKYRLLLIAHGIPQRKT